MRISLHLFCLTALLTTTAHIAPAAAAPSTNDPSIPFSKYGQIQNVQNYSSNPFWNPNSPYNQRMPQPIYAQGTDLDTADCQVVVAALISAYCNTRNYCMNDSLDDIRPTLTVQLAALPNHNYVGSCVGYIDTEFDSYRATHSAAVPTGVVAFPGATAPNAAATGSEYKIENPLAPVDKTWNGVEWEYEMYMRQLELKQLQAQNGAGSEHLQKASFPTTAADLTFAQRMENAAAGYEPYKDMSAYENIDLVNVEEYDTYLASATTKKNDNTTTTENGANSSSNSDKKDKKSTIVNVATDPKATTVYTDKATAANTPAGRVVGTFAAPAAVAGAAAGLGTGALIATITGTAAAGAAAGGTATVWSGPFAIGGAIIGSVTAVAAVLLSDSDVLFDPVTQETVGCNAPVETKAKKADRNVKVGGFMFCAQYKVDADGNSEITGFVPGYARQCMQNKQNPSTKGKRIAGAVLNDFWNEECVERLCDGVEPPSDPSIVTEWIPDKDNVCWSWK